MIVTGPQETRVDDEMTATPRCHATHTIFIMVFDRILFEAAELEDEWYGMSSQKLNLVQRDEE